MNKSIKVPASAISVLLIKPFNFISAVDVLIWKHMQISIGTMNEFISNSNSHKSDDENTIYPQCYPFLYQISKNWKNMPIILSSDADSFIHKQIKVYCFQKNLNKKLAN